MKTSLPVIALVFLIAGTPLTAASADLVPGKWEITVKMEMEGMPFPMPPTVYTQCISAEDLKDAEKTLPSSPDKKNDCVMKNVKTRGNRVTWSMQCKDGTNGSGEMTYKRTSYDGVIEMEKNRGRRRGRSKMLQHISARRIGDCK